MLLPFAILFFSLSAQHYAVEMSATEAEAYHTLIEALGLTATLPYSTATRDCPVRNSNVQCWPNDALNPAKRGRLKFLYAKRRLWRTFCSQSAHALAT